MTQGHCICCSIVTVMSFQKNNQSCNLALTSVDKKKKKSLSYIELVHRTGQHFIQFCFITDTDLCLQIAFSNLLAVITASLWESSEAYCAAFQQVDSHKQKVTFVHYALQIIQLCYTFLQLHRFKYEGDSRQKVGIKKWQRNRKSQILNHSFFLSDQCLLLNAFSFLLELIRLYFSHK